MPGSISQNLPNYFGIKVSCNFIGATDLSNSKITCKNIGQLFKAVEYKIGCRATFPYDQFNLPLEKSFGTITLYSVTPNGRDKNPLTVSVNPVQYI